MKVITATFRGKCAGCGDWFGAGSRITKESTGWTHAECADDGDLDPGPAVVCQACHLTIPCDCEDCDCLTHQNVDEGR